MNSSVFLNYLNLKADKNHTHPEYEGGGGGGSVTNVVTKTEYEADKIITNQLIAKKANIEDLKATNAEITNLKAENAVINNLVASKADIIELDAQVARIENLYATKAEITELDAVRADINVLNADNATINNLLAGNLTAGNIQAGSITSNELATGTITAGSGVIADGAIGNAQISKLSADKLEAGTIDTSKVVIQGSNGHMRMRDNRFQVFEGIGSDAFERVSLGDVNGDGTAYGFRVRGKDGTTILYDENGVREEGITDGAITNEKISNSAEIDGAKLNIASVINKINEDGTGTIEGFKVSIDGTSLDTKLERVEQDITEHTTSIKNNTSKIEANEEAIKLKVSEQIYQEDKTELTSQLDRNTSSIEALQGEIALKVEQTHIENAKSEMEGIMDSKVEAAKGEIKVTTDSITQSVTNLTQTTNTKADRTTVNNLQSKVGILETSVNGIKGTVSNLETTTNTLEDELSSTQTQLTQTKSQLATLDVNLRSITQRVSNTESTVSNVSTVADSKAKIFTSQPIPPYKLGDIWVQGVSGEIMKCRTARASGNFLASDWDRASKYTDDTKVNTLRNEYNYTKSQVAEIVTDLDGITQRVSDTETTTSNLSNEISGIDEKITTTNSKVASIETNLNGISQRVSDVETESSTTSNNLSNLQTTVTNTSNKVASIETNLSGITQRVETVETQQKTANNNISSLNTRMNSAESKITDSAIINTVSSTIKESVDKGVELATKSVNLAKNSKTFSSTKLNSWTLANSSLQGFKEVKISTTETGERKCEIPIYADINTLKSNITISFEISTTQDSSFALGFAVFRQNGEGIQGIGYVPISDCVVETLSGGWRRLSYTFNPDDYSLNNRANAYEYKILFIKKSNTSGTINIAIRKPKLEIGSKSTDWTIAPQEIETEIDSKVSEAKSEIKQTTDSITQRVSSVETTSTQAINLAKVMSNGKILHPDVAFRKGANNVNIYNNSGNGTVTISRISKISDCPTTSTHCLEIKTTGIAAPGNGGFYQGIQSRANAIFIQKFIAKVPSGLTLNTASNSMGTGYTDKWLTSNKGTGKWEEYIREVRCGSTGTFSGGGHVYVSGASPSSSSPLVWYLASCTAYDITDSDERITDLTTRMSSAESKITSSAIINTVSSTIDNKVNSAVNTAKSQIKQTTDSIQNTVTNINNNYASKSQLTQTVNKFEFNFKARGGNKIRSSMVKEQSGVYGFANRSIHGGLPAGRYTFTINGSALNSSGHLEAYIYTGGWTWSTSVGVWGSGNSTSSITFDLPSNVANQTLYIASYNYPSGSSGQVRIEWYCLTEGDYPVSQWIPHDEEIISGVTHIDNEGVKVSHQNGSYSRMNNTEFFQANESGNRTLSMRYGASRYYKWQHDLGYVGGTAVTRVGTNDEYGINMFGTGHSHYIDLGFASDVYGDTGATITPWVRLRHWENGIYINKQLLNRIQFRRGFQVLRSDFGESWGGLNFMQSGSYRYCVAGDQVLSLGNITGYDGSSDSYTTSALFEIHREESIKFKTWAHWNFNWWTMYNMNTATVLNAQSEYLRSRHKDINEVYGTKTTDNREIRCKGKNEHTCIGETIIEIPQIIAENIQDDYQVHISKYGFGDYYIKERNPYYFVIEADREFSFDWEVVATQIEKPQAYTVIASEPYKSNVCEKPNNEQEDLELHSKYALMDDDEIEIELLKENDELYKLYSKKVNN